MAYDILNAHDLCQFYALAPGAGKRLTNPLHEKTFAWLDDPQMAEHLLDFKQERRAKVRFHLPDMHCAACIWLLEHLYRLDAGVLRSTVNFPQKTVSIDFDPTQTTLRRLAAMLASVGYPPHFSLADAASQPQARRGGRRLLYQIGLTGFVMGNVMLLSFPEYLGLQREHDAWFFGVFGYLNLLLSVPVLLFAARDYFVSAWNGLKNKHLNIDLPVSLGLFMLFARSAFEVLTQTGAGYFDSFVALVFLLLCGKWFQQLAFHRLSFERDFRAYFPIAATRRRQQREEAVALDALAAGDMILVRNGELVPADGVLARGVARVDYSFVTGESEPVAVAEGEKIFAGGKQCGDLIEVVLTRTVSQSYLTQLWNDEAFRPARQAGTDYMADRAGRWFTYLTLGIGGLCLLYWWVWRGDVATAINTFTAVFMVACPCAIAVSIPFTMGNVLRWLSRHGFYLKNAQVVERLLDVDAVVFDKTGTITTLHTTDAAAERVQFEAVSGAGTMAGISPAALTAIKSLCYRSNHPLSRQIYAALPAELPLTAVTDFSETPGRGVQGRVGQHELRLGSADFTGADMVSKNGVFVAMDGAVLGRFEVAHHYRPGLRAVLDFFRAPRSGRSATVFLLSGDHDRERATLHTYFPDDDTLFFEKKPAEKLDFIKKLQGAGRRVLFFGDGLNDAGALRQAEVGVVVSEHANNFTPASDAILRADAFGRLPQFLGFARQNLRLIRASFGVAILYNIMGLSYAVTGALSPLVAAVLMPVSSVTLVLIGTAGSHWLARHWGLAAPPDKSHPDG